MTRTYRPGFVPSINSNDGDRVYLKQELDKLQTTINALQTAVSAPLQSPALTIKGNNTNMAGNTLDLSILQVQQMLGGLIPLLANTTFWVSNTGSDTTGLGTQTSPWATFNFAYNFIASTYNFKNHTITIKSVAAQTYSAQPILANILFPWIGGGSLVFDGNGSTFTSVNYGIVTNGAPLGGVVSIQNFTLNCGNACLYHAVGGQMFTGPGMTFASWGSPGCLVMAGPGSYCLIQNNISISCSSGANFVNITAGGAEFHMEGITITGVGSFTLGAFVNMIGPSIVFARSITFAGTLNPFTGSGQRFNIAYNSVLFCGGVATYFPGTIAGTNTNALYV